MTISLKRVQGQPRGENPPKRIKLNCNNAINSLLYCSDSLSVLISHLQASALRALSCVSREWNAVVSKSFTITPMELVSDVQLYIEKIQGELEICEEECIDSTGASRKILNYSHLLSSSTKVIPDELVALLLSMQELYLDLEKVIAENSGAELEIAYENGKNLSQSIAIIRSILHNRFESPLAWIYHQGENFSAESPARIHAAVKRIASLNVIDYSLINRLRVLLKFLVSVSTNKVRPNTDADRHLRHSITLIAGITNRNDFEVLDQAANLAPIVYTLIDEWINAPQWVDTQGRLELFKKTYLFTTKELNGILNYRDEKIDEIFRLVVDRLLTYTALEVDRLIHWIVSNSSRLPNNLPYDALQSWNHLIKSIAGGKTSLTVSLSLLCDEGISAHAENGVCNIQPFNIFGDPNILNLIGSYLDLTSWNALLRSSKSTYSLKSRSLIDHLNNGALDGKYTLDQIVNLIPQDQYVLIKRLPQPVTDKELTCILTQFPSLQSLSVKGIPDCESLKPLNTLSKLKTLSIEGAVISTLSFLSKSIESLAFHQCALQIQSEESYSFTCLSITESTVTDIEFLKFSNCRELTLNWIGELRYDNNTLFPTIQSLNVSNPTEGRHIISPKFLQSFPSLNYLNCSNIRTSPPFSLINGTTVLPERTMVKAIGTTKEFTNPDGFVVVVDRQSSRILSTLAPEGVPFDPDTHPELIRQLTRSEFSLYDPESTNISWTKGLDEEVLDMNDLVDYGLDMNDWVDYGLYVNDWDMNSADSDVNNWEMDSVDSDVNDSDESDS